MEYLHLSIKEIHEAILSKKVTPLELVEEALRKDMSAMSKTGMMNKKFYDDIQAALKEYRGE